MKASVYSLEGKVSREIKLPKCFEELPRPDLIKRAVLSDESKLKQPKGNYPWAGFETSARYRGRKEDYGAVKNRGIPHLPHEVLPKGRLGKVKRVPLAVKGHRAHPPKPEKKIVEKINKKEYEKALKSAISMTAMHDIVAKRMNEKLSISLPLVIDSKFEEIKKTKEALQLLQSLNLSTIIEKAKNNGKKGPLIVVSKFSKAAKNIPGVDVIDVKKLKVMHLAPGAHPGRLTIYTENAIDALAKKFGDRV
ncbi:MAG: 50S ribosomal protein L4 [Candidatus Bilamarchaeaceae archaeon]